MSTAPDHEYRVLGMVTNRERVLQAQHQRLLDGLAESIRERGLALTGVGEIVRHAKASRRTFYNHFEDKDACFVELARRTAAAVMAEVVASLDPDATLLEQIDAAIDAYLRALRSDFALTVTIYTPGLGEAVLKAQQDVMERWAAFLATTVQASTGVRMSSTRAYMLMSGASLALARGLARGEDLDVTANEIKDILKIVGATIQAEADAASRPAGLS